MILDDRDPNRHRQRPAAPAPWTRNRVHRPQRRLKLVVFTLPGTAAFFESLGLPGVSAYLVFGAEALGGVLIALGLFTR